MFSLYPAAQLPISRCLSVMAVCNCVGAGDLGLLVVWSVGMSANACRSCVSRMGATVVAWWSCADCCSISSLVSFLVGTVSS